MNYLFVKTAPVMMNARPAVLVRLTNCGRIRELQRYDQFCRQQAAILAVLQLDFLILKNDGRNIQILFYDDRQLQRTLSEPELRAYLLSLGYEADTTTAVDLVQLRRRFSGENFPHEIG
ncbi:MAG: DUF3793 family protein, partial [Victivallales bacterium]|nr:DUF3793 family protein [Victivallales bacterium]